METMMEPLLLTRSMRDDDDLNIHRYPLLLLIYDSILAALLTLLYVVHWDLFDLGILDFHTSSESIILDQIILTLVFFGIPWVRYLWTYGRDGLVIEESVRADIKDAHVFLKFLTVFFLIVSLAVILIDVALKRPFQSILIAYLFIFLSLSLWHNLRKIILRRQGRAVDTTIANLLEIAEQMKIGQDSDAHPTAGA